jgi:hypothetical protein
MSRLLLAVHAYLLHRAICSVLVETSCERCMLTRAELIDAHDDVVRRLEDGEILEGVSEWPS